MHRAVTIMSILKLRKCSVLRMCVFVVLMLSCIGSTVFGYSGDRDHHSGGSNAEHYFRHQQHYNQRVEQAVNDFRASQRHRIANASHQVLLRHRHFDLAEEDEDTPPAKTTGAPTAPVGRHHLRHYNRHHQTWEQRVFPALRYQVTTPTTSAPSTTTPDRLRGSTKSRNLHPRRDHINLSAAVQGRFFDRDGLYTSSNPTKTKHSLTGPREPHTTRLSKGIEDERNRLEDGLLRPNIIANDDNSNDDDDDDYYEDDEDDGEDGSEDSLEGDDDDDDDEEEDSDADEEDDVESIFANNAAGDRGHLRIAYRSSQEDVDENANRIDNNKISVAKHHSNSIVDQTSSNVFTKPYIPGTLTRHKYETLGTHEAVKQSRRNHITNQQHHRALANAHVTKVHTEATCKWPKPKVEKIQKDPSKLYVPHCTILHRCSDDTGCCSTDLKTCIAKRTQAVDLYFFVKSLGSKRGTIERHTFVNHTECHCINKSKYNTVLQSTPAFMRRATILDCNCPRPFEKVLQENGVCRCDCSSGNTGCDWLKRGMEHFSMSDRKCIMEGRCKHPTCEYGNYDKDHGRCPKKEIRSFH